MVKKITKSQWHRFTFRPLKCIKVSQSNHVHLHKTVDDIPKKSRKDKGGEGRRWKDRRKQRLEGEKNFMRTEVGRGKDPEFSVLRSDEEGSSWTSKSAGTILVTVKVR